MNAHRLRLGIRPALVLLGVLVCAQLPAQDARLYGRFTSGGFRTLSEAQQLWTAGVKARAQEKKGDLLFGGNFGFELATGQDMMGSMFTEPGYYPIDVLEFTPGPKTRQTYDIAGSVAWQKPAHWEPGLLVRFRGVNYAKLKDLRHTTYRQETQFVPSLRYKAQDFMVGASYGFEKTSEFIQAEQIGSATADTYYAFLDKGLRYGTLQAWNGSGIHLAEAGVDRLPVKEFSHTLSLEATWKENLQARVSYAFTRGEVGEKGYTWFRFPGGRLEAGLEWKLSTSSGEHAFGAVYTWFHQNLYESVLERETVGGVTTPTLYGSRLILARKAFQVAPSWQFESRRGWSLGVQASFNNARDRSTLMYPFLDYDESSHMEVTLQASVPIGRFVLGASLGGRNKIGERQHVVDRDDEGIGVSSTPFRLSQWWDPEQEVQDAPCLLAGLSVRYNLPGRLPLFVEAGFEYRHAFDVVLLPGNSRQSTLLTLGYYF